MAVSNAERSDDEIDCLVNRDPLPPQQTVMLAGSNSEIRIEHRDNLEFAQCLLQGSGVSLRARTLQELAQNKIADEQGLVAQQFLQFECLRSRSAIEEI